MLMRGAWGFSVFAVLAIFLDRFSVFVPKKIGFFRFWYSLRFADFPYFSIWFSVFVKNMIRYFGF